MNPQANTVVEANLGITCNNIQNTAGHLINRNRAIRWYDYEAKNDWEGVVTGVKSNKPYLTCTVPVPLPLYDHGKLIRCQIRSKNMRVSNHRGCEQQVIQSLNCYSIRWQTLQSC